MSEHTPTPWNWTIHDSSAATLHGHDDMLNHVLTVSPCKHCRGEEWQWGACTNPTQVDAAFIVKAVNNHEALVKALRQIEATSSTWAASIARDALRAMEYPDDPVGQTRGSL